MCTWRFQSQSIVSDRVSCRINTVGLSSRRVGLAVVRETTQPTQPQLGETNKSKGNSQENIK